MLITIGTTPVQIFPANPRRISFMLQMLAVAFASGNTGFIHIGKGFQPIPTAGHNAQGEVLTAGSNIEELKEFDGDTRPYKGPIWAVASVAGQLLEAQEQIGEQL